MKNWKSLMITAAMLAVMSSVQSVHAQSPQPPPSSAQSSPSSAIPADKTVESRESGVRSRTKTPAHDSRLPTPDLIPACMATAVELEKTRALAAALENENRALKEGLEIEKRLTVLSS